MGDATCKGHSKKLAPLDPIWDVRASSQGSAFALAWRLVESPERPVRFTRLPLPPTPATIEATSGGGDAPHALQGYMSTQWHLNHGRKEPKKRAPDHRSPVLLCARASDGQARAPNRSPRARNNQFFPDLPVETKPFRPGSTTPDFLPTRAALAPRGASARVKSLAWRTRRYLVNWP
jgi:hypothetical protein